MQHLIYSLWYLISSWQRIVTAHRSVMAEFLVLITQLAAVACSIFITRLNLTQTISSQTWNSSAPLNNHIKDKRVSGNIKGNSSKDFIARTGWCLGCKVKIIFPINHSPFVASRRLWLLRTVCDSTCLRCWQATRCRDWLGLSAVFTYPSWILMLKLPVCSLLFYFSPV